MSAKYIAHALLKKRHSFNAHGVFYPLPWIDTRNMALLFRDKVFAMVGLN